MIEPAARGHPFARPVFLPGVDLVKCILSRSGRRAGPALLSFLLLACVGSAPILTAPPHAAAQSTGAAAAVQSLLAALDSGDAAVAAQLAAPGLALALPGGVTWNLAQPQSLPASLLPVTATSVTPDAGTSGAVDATLQFGAGLTLSARFLVNGGQVVAAALASEAVQTGPLSASAAAAGGASMGITAMNAAGDAATVSAKGPASASVDASNSAAPVACTAGGSVLATIGGTIWLCTNGVVSPD
jgi:hypothetical protein